MAYDRYDPERARREGRSSYSDERRPYAREREERDFEREREHRGFFDRASDQVRSWFGDEDADRDHRRERETYERGQGRERGDRWASDRGSYRAHQDRDDPPGWLPMNWAASDRDYRPEYQDDLNRRPERDMRDSARQRQDPRQGSEWDRDEYRRTSFAGSRARSNPDDLHYDEWRRRQMEDLDRDYDEYRRECNARFESDFGGWRERRQTKRQMLRDIREHMEVVGSDDQYVGKVDRVAGDRIILTKSDPDAGGVHHSISCSEVARIDGDRVVLESSAEQAKQRWRDDSRERALFEREDQGQDGPHILDRSFSGTYR
jgi:hypothetical protein